MELLRKRNAWLEAELTARDSIAGVEDRPTHIQSLTTETVRPIRGEEAPVAATGHTITDVVPFVANLDDPAERARRVPALQSRATVVEDSVVVSRLRSLGFLETRMGLADLTHDSAWRGAMIEAMRKDEQYYSEEETRLLTEGMGLLGSMAEDTGKVLKRAKTVELARITHHKKSGLLLGEVKLVVPASPEQLVAFLMHVDSKFFTSRLNSETDVAFEILEVKNLHCSIVFSEMKTAPFTNRTFLNACLWRKVSDTPLTFAVVAVPIERHAKIRAEREGYAVRAHATRAFRVTRTADGETILEYACSLDLKGHFPSYFTRTVALPALLVLPYDLQSYFAQVKPAPECTARNGVLLGHLLADVAEKALPQQRASAITGFVLRTTVFRESGFVFLDALFAAIFVTHYGLGKFKTIFTQPVSTADPAALTLADATTIGNGLEAIIRTSANPAEAVDELILTYPAIGVMAQQHVWFRPMFETIVLRRLTAAVLGLRLRLAFGVIFTMCDMGSDIYQIVNRHAAGQSMVAFALFGIVLANLLFQLLLVFVQNSHRGRRAIAWEVFLVLSLLKPGVDAIRVASGEEQIAGSPLNPFDELMISKLFEVVFEAIPGSQLLTIAFLYGGEINAFAAISIVLSCLSTAFTVTLVAYDLDTNKANRKSNPHLFGYSCHSLGAA